MSFQGQNAGRSAAFEHHTPCWHVVPAADSSRFAISRRRHKPSCTPCSPRSGLRPYASSSRLPSSFTSFVLIGEVYVGVAVFYFRASLSLLFLLPALSLASDPRTSPHTRESFFAGKLQLCCRFLWQIYAPTSPWSRYNCQHLATLAFPRHYNWRGLEL